MEDCREVDVVTMLCCSTNAARFGRRKRTTWMSIRTSSKRISSSAWEGPRTKSSLVMDLRCGSFTRSAVSLVLPQRIQAVSRCPLRKLDG